MTYKTIIRENLKTGTTLTKTFDREANGDIKIRRSVTIPRFFGLFKKSIQKRDVTVRRH